MVWVENYRCIQDVKLGNPDPENFKKPFRSEYKILYLGHWHNVYKEWINDSCFLFFRTENKNVYLDPLPFMARVKLWLSVRK